MKTSVKTFFFLALSFFTSTLLLSQINDAKISPSPPGEAVNSISTVNSNVGYSVVIKGDDAVVTVQTLPVEMDKEHIYSISYTVRNTGTTTWKTGIYKLQISINASFASDNTKWLVPNVDIPNDVSPGGEVTITTNVTAWNDDGSYSFTAQMVRNDAPFGQTSSVTVVTIH
jgi:hypothetical protein